MNENENKKIEEDKNEEATSNKPINDEKKETKKIENDKKKLTKFFDKNKDKKKTIKPGQKSSKDVSSSKDVQKHSLNETNFLIQRNDPNFKEGKQYKEDEIGKTLKAKGFKDLINEKNGNFDVNKMNEDQYNQLRLLNNLHNIANSIKQDSDSEISVTSSISSLHSTKEENNDIILDVSLQEMPKGGESQEISKEKMQKCKEENIEIENIKKELEKEIGNDLVKEIINLLEKSSDKTEVKFDRESAVNKIKELANKGFDKAKVEKAIEKKEEIFAVFMKEKII